MFQKLSSSGLRAVVENIYRLKAIGSRLADAKGWTHFFFSSKYYSSFYIASVSILELAIVQKVQQWQRRNFFFLHLVEWWKVETVIVRPLLHRVNVTLCCCTTSKERKNVHFRLLSLATSRRVSCNQESRIDRFLAEVEQESFLLKIASWSTRWKLPPFLGERKRWHPTCLRDVWVQARRRRAEVFFFSNSTFHHRVIPRIFWTGVLAAHGCN